MRRLALAISSLALLAACGEQPSPAPKEPAPPPVGVSASDELTGMSAPATGIAYWLHPNVPFKSLMIVAGAKGVVAYNIEDGAEISRIDDVEAQGAAVSYFGFGPEATGALAFYNKTANAFEIDAVDNASRDFEPLNSDVAVRGDVRGFCFGRAADVAEPSLFVIQKDKLSIFNFAPLGDEDASPRAAVGGSVDIDIPAKMTSCAVDTDGVVLLASEDGEIYKLKGENSFVAPFAQTAVGAAGDLAVIAADAPEDGDKSVYGALALLDKSSGAIRFFDRQDGHALGAATIAATDDIDGVAAAGVMGATGANLGAVYRNGMIALALGGETPTIRLIPVNGVLNALSLPAGAPTPLRGEAPKEDDNGLIIPTTFNLPQPSAD